MPDDTEGGFGGLGIGNPGSYGGSNDTSGFGGSDSDSSSATGYGGFGDLGIGNPGSYGGQQSVGAPGFEGDYGEGDDSYDKAWDGFTTGNYLYGFEQLAEGLFASAVEYGVSALGGNIGLTLGSAFGGYGALVGYAIGKYVGAEIGEEIAKALLKGEADNSSTAEINDILKTIARNEGTTPSEIIKKVSDGLNEEGIESFLKDISGNFQKSAYYEIGLSRRRINIIGTGRRGLTIE